MSPQDLLQLTEPSTRDTNRIGTGAAPVPNPIPVPVPPIVGPRIRVYKQDPTVTDPGARIIFVASPVLNGPADARLVTDLPGTTPVARNVDGDFLFAPDTPQFDAAHSFAVAHETITMYERHNNGNPIPFAWNSGGNTDKLTVKPHAGQGANAFYSRTGKSLSFLSFTPSGQTAQVFTCRSLDIVAHETGHSVLDGLKPGWLAAGNPPQTGGLHESWGDLTAIFLALSEPDQAESFVALTKANLHAKSFLSALAEQFGMALGMPFGLRNADNDLKLSQVGNEVHAISQVFTGGVYDVLADIFAFEYQRRTKTESATAVLIDVARRLCKLLFDAVVAAPATKATYADVVNKMLQISNSQGDPAIYRTFLRNRFTLREVVVSATPLTDLLSGRMDMADAGYLAGGEDALELPPHDEHSASLRAVQDRSACCGTMQMTEFHTVAPERLAKRGPLHDDDILHDELSELKRAFK